MNADALFDQKSQIHHYLNCNSRFLSSFSFVNIFLWKDFFQYEFKTVESFLCIFAKSEVGTFLYLPPLGEGDVKRVWEYCFDYMQDNNADPKVSRIENGDFCFATAYSAQYIFKEKYKEFYYYKNDIAHYRGNAYKSQRALYNFFIKNYSYRSVSYERSMEEECLALLKDWTQKKQRENSDPIFCQMLDENVHVNELALRFREELGLVGRVVFVDDQIKAYTFGFELNQDTFCVLFEIADIKTKGLSCFIFREFASQKELSSYKFLNGMDAWGLKNVARTKELFRPSMLVPSYIITQKENIE